MEDFHLDISKWKSNSYPEKEEEKERERERRPALIRRRERAIALEGVSRFKRLSSCFSSFRFSSFLSSFSPYFSKRERVRERERHACCSVLCQSEGRTESRRTLLDINNDDDDDDDDDKASG